MAWRLQLKSVATEQQRKDKCGAKSVPFQCSVHWVLLRCRNILVLRSWYFWDWWMECLFRFSLCQLHRAAGCLVWLRSLALLLQLPFLKVESTLKHTHTLAHQSKFVLRTWVGPTEAHLPFNNAKENNVYLSERCLAVILLPGTSRPTALVRPEDPLAPLTPRRGSLLSLFHAFLLFQSVAAMENCRQ